MRCQLIQTNQLNDNNLAEKEMLNFLKNLPESYFVYRELKLTPAYYEQTRGMEEQRPDFVIVGPKTGLVSIEIKDWNLFNNKYEWLDQYHIKKTDSTGMCTTINNPVDQISRYQYGFIDLLKSQNRSMWVTSLLAFPRISKANFLSQVGNIEILINPQSRFYLDIERTIFNEDLDRYFNNPEKLFWLILRKDNRIEQYNAQDIKEVNRILLPASFRIGGYSKRQANKEQLNIISKKQQEWIFGIKHNSNYLLDVPGSGKTNALISKAIHMVDQNRYAPLKILITTYSKNLETNIQRIFQNKITNLHGNQIYQQNITIQCIPDLIILVLGKIFSPGEIADHRTKEKEFNSWAKVNVKEILSLSPNEFRIFDAIFVDEIQDFDNFYLILMSYLNKSDRYFIVGDIGQKIYERSYDLHRIGIIPHQIELPKSYQMYRTPQYIGRLAVDFVWSDKFCRKEFIDRGYTGKFDFPNELENLAEILKSNDPVNDIVLRIKELTNSHFVHDDILVIASEIMLRELSLILEKKGVPYMFGEPKQDGFVALVSFRESKGLEREIVFVTGIEDLYERKNSEGLFWDPSKKLLSEGLSRRMIYVAITRTIEQLIIFYQDPLNVFINELLKANKKIMDQWV